jgi:hypothetical protein
MPRRTMNKPGKEVSLFSKSKTSAMIEARTI